MATAEPTLRLSTARPRVEHSVDFCHNKARLKNSGTPASEGRTPMAQWIKILGAKPNNVSSITRTHMMEGENGLRTPAGLTSPCVPGHMCMNTYKYTQTKINNDKTRESSCYPPQCPPRHPCQHLCLQPEPLGGAFQRARYARQFSSTNHL